MTTEETIEACEATTRFHREFDEIMENLVEECREQLLNSGPNDTIPIPTRETIIAQLMIDNIFAHPLDSELYGDSDWPNSPLTTEQKKSLVVIASYMGADWAQALYRAAVFITKVA
jgi:hypothetical protein